MSQGRTPGARAPWVVEAEGQAPAWSLIEMAASRGSSLSREALAVLPGAAPLVEGDTGAEAGELAVPWLMADLQALEQTSEWDSARVCK